MMILLASPQSGLVSSRSLYVIPLNFSIPEQVLQLCNQLYLAFIFWYLPSFACGGLSSGFLVPPLNCHSSGVQILVPPVLCVVLYSYVCTHLHRFEVDELRPNLLLFQSYNFMTLTYQSIYNWKLYDTLQDSNLGRQRTIHPGSSAL